MSTPKFNFSDPSDDAENGKKCLFCGSGDLIQGVTLLDRTDSGETHLKLGKDRKPYALLFKGRERAETMAVVCGGCGFVHLFATNPKVLKRVGG